jgi:hypothetical protein
VVVSIGMLCADSKQVRAREMDQGYTFDHKIEALSANSVRLKTMARWEFPMTIIRVRARADGRVVRWSDLKRGRLVDATRLGRFTSFTTTLTDVVTDLCLLAESLDRQYRMVTVVPNGHNITSFDLALIGDGFEMTCGRRLVRGWFPLNPLAPEFGCNYDVVVTVTGSSDQVHSALLSLLNAKYKYLMVT